MTDERRYIRSALQLDAKQDMTLARYAEYGSRIDLITAIATAQAILAELEAEAQRVGK